MSLLRRQMSAPRPWILGLTALLSAAAPLTSQAQSYSGDLPQIGEPADAAMSPSEERRIGAKVVGELYTRNYILEDPEITEFITGLGWRIAAASTTRPPELNFFVIRDRRINAFALPGGFIGVNAGLLTASHTESELSGVLAHELAHVTQRHIARSIESTEVANLATWAAVLAAILAGSADPDVVIAALSLGQATMYERQVGFTRAHELEADRIGIQTLARAGFDPQGMASFFVRLEQQSRLYGNAIPEFLRTHPVNTTRISEARSRAADLPENRGDNSMDFDLMRARARVLLAEHPGQALEYFSVQVEREGATPGNLYGLALAQSRLGQYDKVMETLDPLLESRIPAAPVALLAGRAQLAAGEDAAALQTLRRTLERFPRYAPAIFEYADALLAVGRPEDARQVLISHEQALGTRLETFRLLAQAAREAGRSGEAQYQTANYLFGRGDAHGALAALDAGLRLKTLSKDDRAKLAARRAEIAEVAPRHTRPPSTRSRYYGSSRP